MRIEGGDDSAFYILGCARYNPELLGKAIGFEACLGVAPNRGHQHDLINGCVGFQLYFDPYRVLGFQINIRAVTDGSDPAAQAVVSELIEFAVDCFGALL